MHTFPQIAAHLRQVYFGGNWTEANVQQILTDVTWNEAVTKVGSLNTIAMLTYHIHYFVNAVIPVLQGGALNSNDKLSFNHPPINNAADWQTLLDKTYADAETLAKLIEQLPSEKLGEPFTDTKYGSYYRNLQGTIEHAHYHLGQIALLKKLVRDTTK